MKLNIKESESCFATTMIFNIVEDLNNAEEKWLNPDNDQKDAYELRLKWLRYALQDIDELKDNLNAKIERIKLDLEEYESRKAKSHAI